MKILMRHRVLPGKNTENSEVRDVEKKITKDPGKIKYTFRI